MGPNQANIKAVITAEDKASKALKGFGDNVDHVGHSVGKVAKTAAIALAAVGAAAVGFGALSVKAFMESQNAAAQLGAVLKSTNNVIGLSETAIQDMASQLQKVTRFSDEAIVQGQSLLLTFTKIGKDIFPEATEIMLDMSQALGQDLKSSAIQLGKALQDPILGITALRRVGVNFNDEQKEVVKNLVETGRSAEAQRLILKELQTEFGGSARAAGQTFAGQLDRLKNAFNDIQETIGLTILKYLTPLVTKIAEFVNAVDWEIVIKRSVQALKDLGEVFRLLFSGDFRRGIFGMTEDDPFIHTLFAIRENVLGVWQAINRVVDTVMKWAEAIATFLMPHITALVNTITQRLWPQIRNLIDAVQPGLTTVLTVVAGILGVTLILAIRIFINALNIAISTLSAVIQAIATVIRWVGELGSWFWRSRATIIGAFSSIAAAITNPFRTAFNMIATLWNGTVGRLSLKVPGWVPGIGGRGWDVPDIPHMAEGGIVRQPTLAMIGEKGPEAVVPLNRGGGMQPVIHIHAGAFMGTQQDARKFAKLIIESYNDYAGSRSMPRLA